MHAAFASRSSHLVSRWKILALAIAVAASSCACGGPTDDGELDADAGSTDAGSTNAGGADAGAVDAGSEDAGQPDAGRALRPFARVACSGAYDCQTPAADVCASLVDLRVGEPFLVMYDNLGASWRKEVPDAGPFFVARFERGTAAEDSQAATGRKRNTATVVYDGDCAVWGRSSYRGDDTESYSVAIAITDAGYAE